MVVVCGGDNTWSDDCTGDGMNWFGLQLMLVRDELRGTSGDGSWTEYIRRQITPGAEEKIMDGLISERINARISFSFLTQPIEES